MTELYATTGYRGFRDVAIPTDGYGVTEFVPRPELVALMSRERWLRKRLLKLVRALRVLSRMPAVAEARWALNVFWVQECASFLREVHDWGSLDEDRYAGASQLKGALVNVHRNAKARLGARIHEADWHRHDVRLYTKVVEG